MIKQIDNRGYVYYSFEDLYGAMCSIQKSSLANEDAIWLGIDDPNPMILASKTNDGGEGWVSYEIPDDVLITTRMHLNQEQAKQLIFILNQFVSTGEI